MILTLCQLADCTGQKHPVLSCGLHCNNLCHEHAVHPTSHEAHALDSIRINLRAKI